MTTPFAGIRYFVLIVSIFLFTWLSTTAQQPWPTATPASVNLIEDSLKSFANDIAKGRYGYIDRMLIIRNGKLVYQQSWQHDYAKIYGDSAKKHSTLNQLNSSGPYNYYNDWWHPFYRRSELHSLQSVTKTISSVIIGVASSRNEFPPVSTPVLHFFDTTHIKNIDARKRRMTVEHLLTMTAGFDWNEHTTLYTDPNNDCMRMEASFDWVDYIINKPMALEPGQSFAYNSGASQILSHIFKKVTGMDIEEYGARYLFEPLGIQQYYWKRTPTGLPDTEGGLYLAATDLARIFYLFLKNGNWNGKQIVTQAWVQASVSPKISLGRTTNYGYKWWLNNYSFDPVKTAWYGSGFGGQFPIAIPEYDIVIVFYAWNVLIRGRALNPNEAIRRVISAVVDRK